MNTSNLFLWICSLRPFQYTATRCGHHTKRTGLVSAFGHETKTKMPKNTSGSVDYCLECIGKMAIQCAWCGNPIFIGDPITLYSPGPRSDVTIFSSEELSYVQKTRRQDGFVIPGGVAIYKENPLILVGCLSLGCADDGMDRAGFWLPSENGKGEVYRVQTVYEAILNAEKPSMMIVNDLGDIKEARNPTLIPFKNL